jgi:NAD(P)-dependent dehydrogenase (short-subunit alcohol dehydrogenase family)
VELPSTDPAGAVVLVTGAGHGIGAGLADRFARAGAAVVVLVDRDGPAADEVATRTAAAYPAVTTLAEELDVADGAAVGDLVARTERRWGGLDVLVANAGIGAGGGLDATDETWQRAWDVNLMAHVHAARAAVPGMLERGGGWFVTTASAAGLLTNLGNAPYSVTKHAAVAFAEWLAVTYGDRGLRVSCVCPMGIDTAMVRDGLDRLEGASVAAQGLMPVDEGVDAVMAGLRSGRFLVLTHPETATFEQHRVADRDRWIAGMQRLQRDVLARLADTGRAVS